MNQTARTLVASGSYVVSKARSDTLEALLGTCVGVVIVDREARVGGLYHILLPEHSSEDFPFAPETYASSGMPRFIQALEKAGADPGRMEASLAGGGLVGRLSPLDLDLDIGGRTVEIVNRFLRELGVPVVQSETGGFNGARIRLNLINITCEIEPAPPEKPGAEVRAPRLTPAELDNAIARVKPIPQVALSIIRTIQSENYSLNEIAGQIRHDQVITANVIRLCNSAFVGAQQEIRSIGQALVMLGGRTVLQVILSSALEGFFGSSNRGYSLTRGGAYHHAVSAGIVSWHVSRLTGKADPDAAYTAGLLHDIGKVVLDQYVGPATALFYGRVVAGGEELEEVERVQLGVTHAEVGARMAELWSFPPSLTDVIAHHSKPEHARHDRDLTHVVYLADLLASRFDFGHDLERLSTDRLDERLLHLGLDAETLPGLIGRIPWKDLAVPGYF